MGKLKKRLSLSERIFICESCGLQLNRDLNAARNLVTASWTETENACYEAGGYSSSGQCSSMKQELNFSQT
ncbi:MAG: zinc ribbon domain-containing protein [Candidatus Hermodarchaeota archaeon]|nr:zinc ribbon domain-containing protein [Candidatus Hermodarchaeota archaeon]